MSCGGRGRAIGPRAGPRGTTAGHGRCGGRAPCAARRLAAPPRAIAWCLGRRLGGRLEWRWPRWLRQLRRLLGGARTGAGRGSQAQHGVLRLQGAPAGALASERRVLCPAAREARHGGGRRGRVLLIACAAPLGPCDARRAIKGTRRNQTTARGGAGGQAAPWGHGPPPPPRASLAAGRTAGAAQHKQVAAAVEAAAAAAGSAGCSNLPAHTAAAACSMQRAASRRRTSSHLMHSNSRSWRWVRRALQVENTYRPCASLLGQGAAGLPKLEVAAVQTAHPPATAPQLQPQPHTSPVVVAEHVQLRARLGAHRGTGPYSRPDPTAPSMQSGCKGATPHSAAPSWAAAVVHALAFHTQACEITTVMGIISVSTQSRITWPTITRPYPNEIVWVHPSLLDIGSPEIGTMHHP